MHSILQELCIGTLAMRVENADDGPSLPGVDEIQYIAGAVSAALEYMHEGGGKTEPFVHRDVRPHNVFIRRTGKVAVGDFGLTRQLQSGSAVTSIAHAPKHTFTAPELLPAGTGEVRE